MRRSEKSLTEDVGTRFGPYDLVRRLGVGGTAETYEAIRRREGGFTQRVCLKVVLPFYRDNPGFTKLFQREAMLAAKLRHRNIVGVIDFGEVDGRSYIALELVDGIDLRTLLDTLDGNRLDPDLVVLFGLELAAALVHAHNPPSGSGFEGLVHRDISPSNVLISRQGEVMLTDFGVAKPKADLRRKSSEAKGKFPYMSPEQLRAEDVDARSDLFAVGVVLFEALAGVRPYEGANDPATIMQILNGEHAELGDWVPDAPPKLAEVIERLIQPDPATRLQNATELIEELAPLAPAPTVQAMLGALVEARMGAERSDPAHEVSSTVGKGRPSASPESERDEANETHASPGVATQARPRERLPLALAVLFVAGVVAVGMWISTPTVEVAPETKRVAEPTPEATTPSKPEVESVSDAAAGDQAERGSDSTGAVRADDRRDTNAADEPVTAAPPSREPKAVPAKPARLDVIVVPWGDIWINGKRRGTAPLMGESLKPGRYRVAAGQDGPAQTRMVRLRAGERKTLKFDLTE